MKFSGLKIKKSHWHIHAFFQLLSVEPISGFNICVMLVDTGAKNKLNPMFLSRNGKLFFC